MAEPFIAEIRMWAGSFAPSGWSFCNGQLVPIAQNTALFSVLGTTYGGDGRTTAGLPNLAGRVPMHAGQGPGLTKRGLGQKGGTENVTLSAAQIASHTHQMTGTNAAANSNEPLAKRPAQSPDENAYNDDPGPPLVPMSGETLGETGGGGPHTNMQPFLSLSFVIAMSGVFPSRR